MNDWQEIVVEELKSINRKLEKLDDSIDFKVRNLEHDMHNELAPIKKHVTQVKFVAVLISILAPLLLGAVSLFIR